MATDETMYPGATHLLDPNYGRFTGYRVSSGQVGGTTGIQTANQLKEVNNLLNTGMKHTEVSLVDMNTFEMIPKEQFQEIYRLGKLTGSEATLHSPIVDPSGFGERGGWNEENRRLAERQLMEVVERGHQLNPDGNVPVTIHSSGNSVGGSEMGPLKDGGEAMQKMIAVNKITGEMQQLLREERFYPHSEGGPKMYQPEEELNTANVSYWDNKLSEVLFNSDKGREILDRFLPVVADVYVSDKTNRNQRHQEIEMKKAMASSQDSGRAQAIQNVENAKIYMENTYQSLMGLFKDAYKVSTEEGKKELMKLSQEFQDKFTNTKKTGGKVFNGVDPTHTFQGNQFLIQRLRELTSPNELAQKIYSEQIHAGKSPDQAMEIMNEKVDKICPKMYEQVEDFVQEKASLTLSNVAINAYKKFGKNAPIISVENPPYGNAVSTGEDLRNLITTTRKKFVDNMVGQGYGKQEAVDAAERMIGVTWDTSHINMIRKQGYGRDKIIEETKKIAPFVKHVHLNDNFGTTHTDLPPGMGNIPLGDVLSEIEKKSPGVRKIFEGGGFFQQFQTSPHPFVLEGLGSAMYDTGGGPYWNQVGVGGGYFSGQGTINPQIHHSVYGAGFTALPSELGGFIPGGTADRFSGTPMH